MNTSSKFTQQSRVYNLKQKKHQLIQSRNIKFNQQQNGSFNNENIQDENDMNVFKSQQRGGGIQEEDDINYMNSKQNIKQILKIIFTFYCSYGDRTNTTTLKSNKFRKLLLDAKIIDNNVDQKFIDLLYTKYTQNKVSMDLSNFCNILAKISSEKYRQIHPSQALIKVINDHLLEIYKFIIKDTDLGKDLQLFDIPIDKDCIIGAKSLYPIFKRIYYAYFSWEPTNSLKYSDNFKQSMNGLFNFLKDYDIFPNLMSRSTSYLLFDQLVENSSSNSKTISPFGYEDIGKLFTLNKFITFIIKASQISFSKFPEASVSQMEYPIQKFIGLLERMELSEGFQSFEKKIHSTHNSNTSLLIPTEAIQEILNQNRDLNPNQLGIQHSMNTPKKDISMRFTENNQDKSIYPPLNKMSPGNFLDETQMKNQSLKQHRKLYLLQSLEIDERAMEIFEKKYNVLQKLFTTFCQYGEPCNTQYLKTIKLQKLLKSAGFMKKNHSQDRQVSPQRQIRGEGKKYIEQTFLDCLIARIVGPNQVRQFTNKMTEHDKSIYSPNIGFMSYSSNKTDNNGSKGKLEFEHFLKIIQEITFELYPPNQYDLYDSLTQTVDQVIHAKIEENDQQTRRMTEDYFIEHEKIAQQEDTLNLLYDVHPSLNHYFKKYCFPKETKMNLDQFLQFCKDFDIFPNLMPKAQLHYIFSTLTQIYKDQNEQQNDSKQSQMYSKQQEDDGEDYISSSLFTEAIAFCAITIYTIEQSYVNRILLLLERMNSSNGPKIQLKHQGSTSAKITQWDLLGDVRKKYQQFYEEKMMKRNKTFNRLHTSGEEANFDTLLDQGFQNYMQNNVNYNY